MIALTESRLGRNGLEFLRDGRGVYGLDFRDKADVYSDPLIIRPDKLGPRRSSTALQPIPSRPPIFKNSVEGRIVHSLHLILFRRSARLDGLDPDGGAQPLRESARLRQKFYGCEAKAYRVCNALVSQLLAEAGDQRALRQARRFRLCERADIYYLATRSDRLLQLCNTFPLLAIKLAESILGGDQDQRHCADQILEAVEAGRPLRHLATLADIPFVMRSIPPAAANRAYFVRELFSRNPHLINCMPTGARAARAWFDMIMGANRISPDYAEWCAKNVEMKRPFTGVTLEVANIGDWIKASYEKHVQTAVEGLAQQLRGDVPEQYIHERLRSSLQESIGAGLVTRTFKPSMSARTVRQLSEAWHDAVANQQFSGDVEPFPKAWASKSEISGYKILPIETPLDLYHEAKNMHNCAMTYGRQVRVGCCYLFSMQKEGQRVATIEIGIGSDGFHLAQLAGPCNQPVNKNVARVIRRWAKVTAFKKESQPTRLPAGMEWIGRGNGYGNDLDAEIPF